MMRICCILDKAEMEADYIQVIEGLAKRGHEVYTFLHTPTTTWVPKIASLKVFCKKEPFLLDRISVVNLLALKTIKEIRKHHLDVIYATGNRLGEGLVAGLATGKPVLCDVRNPWSIQWGDLDKRMSFRTFIGKKVRKIRFLSEERLIHKSDRIVAYSRGIKKWLVSYLKVKEGKITVIPPHVDTNVFRPHLDGRILRERYRLKNSPLIMYVGIINHSRGIDILIKAFAIIKHKIANAKLMVVGPRRQSIYPYLKDLERNINSLGLDGEVIFTDYIPFNHVPNYVAAADILVVPHRHNFTYEISPPVKILEYMACQKPIVTTDVGIRDFVSHEENGIIVEPDNPSDLADGILYLLKNPMFASQLARNARTFVEQNLREEMMIDKFEKALASLVT